MFFRGSIRWFIVQLSVVNSEEDPDGLAMTPDRLWSETAFSKDTRFLGLPLLSCSIAASSSSRLAAASRSSVTIPKATCLESEICRRSSRVTCTTRAAASSTARLALAAATPSDTPPATPDTSSTARRALISLRTLSVKCRFQSFALARLLIAVWLILWTVPSALNAQ